MPPASAESIAAAIPQVEKPRRLCRAVGGAMSSLRDQKRVGSVECSTLKVQIRSRLGIYMVSAYTRTQTLALSDRVGFPLYVCWNHLY